MIDGVGESGQQAPDIGLNALKGKIVAVKFLGLVVRFIVEIGPNRLFADCFNAPHLSVPRVGEGVTIRFSRESCAPTAVNAEALKARIR